ncbi:MAG: hypothetical protein J3K34DRAFT_421056 [Monoraphidium minutum]|nr:MAG: hypothetical protein J3K34DRAFT_421056 [Monoraphidium minutum]
METENPLQHLGSSCISLSWCPTGPGRPLWPAHRCHGGSLSVASPPPASGGWRAAACLLTPLLCSWQHCQKGPARAPAGPALLTPAMQLAPLIVDCARVQGRARACHLVRAATPTRWSPQPSPGGRATGNPRTQSPPPRSPPWCTACCRLGASPCCAVTANSH